MLTACRVATSFSAVSSSWNSCPAAPDVDHLLVLLQAGGVERGIRAARVGRGSVRRAGRRTPCRRRADERRARGRSGAMRTSGRRSISENCTWLETMRMPCVEDACQPLGVEVGQREVTDGAGVAQVRQIARARRGSAGRRSPTSGTAADRGSSVSIRRRESAIALRPSRARHRAGPRHPFGEGLEVRRAPTSPRSAVRRRRNSPTKSSAGP